MSSEVLKCGPLCALFDWIFDCCIDGKKLDPCPANTPCILFYNNQGANIIVFSEDKLVIRIFFLFFFFTDH